MHFKTANASPVIRNYWACAMGDIASRCCCNAAFSAKNIKSNCKQSVNLYPGGGGGGGGVAAPSVSAPPAFNVVGAAPENQLAETISGQDKKPVESLCSKPTEVSKRTSFKQDK